MAINLNKNEHIDLKKYDNVKIGLSWMANIKTSFWGFLFNKPKIADKKIDLDLSLLMLNEKKEVIEQVWFKELKSKDLAVQHSGDNRSGSTEEINDKDTEYISINFNKLNPEVTYMIAVVNSYSGENFNSISKAFCRLYDNKQLLAKFNLENNNKVNNTALVMVAFIKNSDTQNWFYKTIGDFTYGKTIKDFEMKDDYLHLENLKQINE